MVKMIKRIHKLKEYREETFFVAVSLADRYLVHIAVMAIPLPSLSTLAVTVILMAAKLEQPISPSFVRMTRLAEKQFNKRIEK